MRPYNGMPGGADHPPAGFSCSNVAKKSFNNPGSVANSTCDFVGCVYDMWQNPPNQYGWRCEPINYPAGTL
jgi:hypothetical protein